VGNSNWSSMSNSERSSMSNSNRSSMGKVDRGGMGNSDGGSMGNRVSNSNRGSMDSLDNRSLRVLGDSLIGHFSNITIDIISGVGDSLSPAVRKSHLVGASLDSQAIRGLSSSEGRARVVISHSIVEVVGGDLSKVLSSVASNRVGNSPNKRGSMGNMDRGSMGHSKRGGVSYVHRGSMGHSNRGRVSYMNRGGMGHSKRGSVSHSKGGSMSHMDRGSMGQSHWLEGTSSRLSNLCQPLGVVHLGGGADGRAESL